MLKSKGKNSTGKVIYCLLDESDYLKLISLKKITDSAIY